MVSPLLGHLRSILDVKKLADLATVLGGLSAVSVGIHRAARRIHRYVKKVSDRRTLRAQIGSSLYTQEEVLGATEFFVEPDCQSVDPSGGEDFRKVFSTRESAFSALDKLLCSDATEKHSIVLADSGMGKTTLLLNYYARHYRRSGRNADLAVVPLGSEHADREIKSIQRPANTVLLLDAFDEDTQAIQNHRERLGNLLALTADFRHVLITCRTQFFEREDETPKETGLVRVGPTRPGQSREHTFLKVYISPFNNLQVSQYLRRRFPIWNFKKRSRAREIASKTADLTMRPMLLAHIEDLLESNADCIYSIQIYESMIEAWLTREKPFVNPQNLRTFSAELAVDIYTKRKERGSERIPPSEASSLASKLAIPLSGWQLRGRSLLNRDADGNLKFAHRTIMEYLFITKFVEKPKACSGQTWTDQIKRFWWEIAASRYKESGYQDAHGVIVAGLNYGDLEDIEFLSLQPLVTLHHTPRIFRDEQSLLEFINRHVQTNLSFHTHAKFLPGLFKKICVEENGTKVPVVVDFVTGLMWHSICSERVTFDEVNEIAQRLEHDSPTIIKGWRIPTLTELLSLLPTNYYTSSWRDITAPAQKVCDRWDAVLWSSDRLEKLGALKCQFGGENLATSGGLAAVRCVRNFRITENFASSTSDPS